MKGWKQKLVGSVVPWTGPGPQASSRTASEWMGTKPGNVLRLEEEGGELTGETGEGGTGPTWSYMYMVSVYQGGLQIHVVRGGGTTTLLRQSDGYIAASSA